MQKYFTVPKEGCQSCPFCVNEYLYVYCSLHYVQQKETHEANLIKKPDDCPFKKFTSIKITADKNA
jgi:hypothetical protein